MVYDWFVTAISTIVEMLKMMEMVMLIATVTEILMVMI